MSAWAKPGVKCVCVLKGRLPESAPDEPLWEPVVGEAYTIRAIEVVSGHLAFQLEEQWEPRWVYAARRFRPLITKTQEEDLAVFRKLLAGLPLEVDA